MLEVGPAIRYTAPATDGPVTQPDDAEDQMDAMALLCTLHADGPTTLSKLRQSGLNDLAALEDHGAERVAEVLAIAPAQARRFVREAGVLRERLRDDVAPATAPRAAANP